MLLFEDPLPRQKALLTQRNPDTPDQRLGCSVHRNFQATAYEKRIAIDDAIVTTELTPRGSLRFRNRIVAQRSVSSESRHSLMNFAAAVTSKLELHDAILALPLPTWSVQFPPGRRTSQVRVVCSIV